MNVTNFFVGAETGSSFNWSAVAGPSLTFLGVLITVVFGLRTARRTLRANVLSKSRLEWLQALREDLATLLYLGERLYSPISVEESTERYRLVEEMRAASKRLVILLGREHPTRLELADATREFTVLPSSALAERIEILGQHIFREQWNKVRTETGEPARMKALLTRAGTVQPPSTDRVDL